jgi:uncharacterized membrane protein
VNQQLLQTSSTVTASIFQQSSGASFLGLPVTDWVTAISGAIMVAVTVALVYYARTTIEEGKKDRNKDSAEKRLERVYNPMFEILTGAEEHVEMSGLRVESRYRMVPLAEDKRLHQIVENYGHYLRPEEYRVIKQMLTNARYLQVAALYDPGDYKECLDFVSARRDELAKRLRDVSD